MSEEAAQEKPSPSATGMFHVRSSNVHSGGSAGEREQFDAFELAIVLSHFDLGTLEKLKEYPKGSRKAPKLLIKSNHGAYLLKRRAMGKNDPQTVAFCHGLQTHLAMKQFPLPHLIGTKHENNSMLLWNQNIYEMFEFVVGTRYDRSLEATDDAGRIQGLFHLLAKDYEDDNQPPNGSYHGARAVFKALERIPERLVETNAKGALEMSEVQPLIDSLQESYTEASEKVEAIGLSRWPVQVCHNDWHPGNMLYFNGRIVAVIDYDAVRFQQRIIDVANGALQFSVIRSAEDVEQWPEQLDKSRFKRFLMGYDRVNQLSYDELQVIPWLMMEAMIAEASIPIATAGRFAHIDGLSFLKMVRRKVTWLQENIDGLVGVLDG